ncbi:1-acyl-sn-glycerol-3-phosphate acyltransferase alpha-like [Crotalus tigris]|uniref:1-acyl-sn-glycerol-3-phosphate acyltransferase alpha-like n=1 Tax=Crotalus tigris TaxID=88082 RepID=UPI00192F4E76|nr:1-acyl-sn-glycerol-3-phosphate acyltransferase alpha-like [Crotalus tigris]
MAQSLFLVNVFLFFLAVLLLYHFSNIFRYYFRIFFLKGWILVWSFFLLPVLALCGRNVANMRVLRFTMLPLKLLYGIKINVQGATNLNLKGPYVLISNLQCSLDLLGIFQILPKRCTLFVKKESLYMFTVGVVLWLCGFIFIDHKKEAEAVEIISATGDIMLQDHLRIWVFSEGHRTGESTLEPLQREAVHLAVKTQAPIIPVVMSSYTPFLNMKTNKFTSGDITIRILPPVKTKGLSPSDIPDLTDHVWGTILSTFHEISGEPEKQASVVKEDTRQAPNY